MVNFLDITDYRDFLKSYYEKRKEKMPLYSYRMMGSKLGLDASYLYRILQKKQHLPDHALDSAKEILELTGRAAEYFDVLVSCSQVKNHEQKSAFIEKAIVLRDVERKQIQKSELRFLSEWWIPAVRAYLEVTGGICNSKQIAKELFPPITEEQAQEALDILTELGFISKSSSGRMKLIESHLTVSGQEKAKSVRGFQKQVLNLAANALDKYTAKERDVSTLTIAIDSSCFEDISEMLQEFRRLIQKRVEESSSPDRVMQLSMAFFPVTNPETDKK